MPSSGDVRILDLYLKGYKMSAKGHKRTFHRRELQSLFGPEGELVMSQQANSAKNIVLIHGGFVDGAGWEGVYTLLKKDGYNVSIVQNPTASLADDVAFTKRVIAAQEGPVILVGHSYGGVVVTEAGNDPKVQDWSTSLRSLPIRASLSNH